MSETSRILIVEDDATLLRGLSDNFCAAGFEVATAADGQSGLAQALAQPPDLLLLDIMLPLLNGYDLCQRVRQADLRHGPVKQPRDFFHARTPVDARNMRRSFPVPRRLRNVIMGKPGRRDLREMRNAYRLMRPREIAQPKRDLSRH